MTDKKQAVEMPREIWAWHDVEDPDNIKCWVEPICTTGVKFVRADLAETVPMVTVDDIKKWLKIKHKLNDSTAYIMFAKDILKEISEKYPNGIRIVP